MMLKGLNESKSAGPNTNMVQFNDFIVRHHFSYFPGTETMSSVRLKNMLEKLLEAADMN